MYFEEIEFDEECKYGQVRRLQTKMWEDYYSELLAEKEPPKVPFSQALGWKREGMPHPFPSGPARFLDDVITHLNGSTFSQRDATLCWVDSISSGP